METDKSSLSETYLRILNEQRHFHNKGGLLQLSFRKKLLRLFKDLLTIHEEELYHAIHQDFGKSAFETYATELSIIENEIDYFLKNLKKLARPKTVFTNLTNQPGRSKIYADAYGCVLVIAAWNYPYQLSLVPAITALAAGNTVILKPSEIPWNTAKVMEKLINENFPKEVFHVINGGKNETSELLELRFDKIFFTGSPQVGKIVYRAAAKHLTPVTLELGGKSPGIITASANPEIAARRIVWAKFLNAGQTCIAPDYLYVHASIKQRFIEEVKKHIQQFDYQQDSENYTRIINKKHFDRIIALIDPKKVIYGGQTNAEKLFIEPTLMDAVSWNDKVMQEEIFGPVLPILEYQNLDDVFEQIKAEEKPLSAYIFTEDSAEKHKFTSALSFGGGCVNDAIMHITNPHLPFGGIGNSGMGHYHGKYGFKTFTHQKSVLHKSTRGEPLLKYPPYSEVGKKWLKRIL